jgi:hypothetical protein
MRQILFLKQRLNKKLQNRDIEAEELSDQVIEKESQLKKLGNYFASNLGFNIFYCEFYFIKRRN